MATRGITVLLLLFLLHASASLPACAQSKEEGGKYKLSTSGKDSGVEEYRLEEFEDGKVVLFAKAKFEIDLSGAKRAYLTDTVLTMDKAYAPALYAGFRKAGR